MGLFHIKLPHISLPHISLPLHVSLPHINIGKAISSVEHAVGKEVGHLAHEVGHAASTVGKGVGHLAHQVGHAVGVGARAVGKEVGHLAHEVEHAAGAVGKGVGHLAHEVEHDVESAAKFIGHEAGAGLHLAGHVLEQIAVAVGDFVLRLRPLHPAEIAVARNVFQNTIPYDRVLILPLSGLGGRPFTIPGTMMMTATGAITGLVPGIGTIFLSAELLAGLYNKYVIFMGSQGYQDALNHPFDALAPGQTFIHELTHVWQGHNQAFAWDYVYHSIKDQCSLGGGAYNYDVSGHPPWNSLRVESQARVVDHWFGLGMPTYGTLYDYIRDNIRTASPNGKTNFPPLLPGQSDPGLTSIG